MHESYWSIKLYVGAEFGGSWFCGPQAKAMAREAFRAIAGSLGNPHLSYRRGILASGVKIGELCFDLEVVERIELVEVTRLEERVIDSVSRE